MGLVHPVAILVSNAGLMEELNVELPQLPQLPHPAGVSNPDARTPRKILLQQHITISVRIKGEQG